MARVPGYLCPIAIALPLLLPALWPTDAAAAICDDTDVVRLDAGRVSKQAGDVKVCNGVDSDGDDFLRVIYEPTTPNCLLEANLHVAPEPEDSDVPDDADIPQNSLGLPTPHQFAFGDGYVEDRLCFDGALSYEIELDDIDGGVSYGDTLVIAAHAWILDEDQKVEETWAAGTSFVERGSWATYFTYVVVNPAEAEYTVFGNAGASGTCGENRAWQANDMLAQRYEIPVDGLLMSVSAWVHSETGLMRMAVFADGVNAEGELLDPPQPSTLRGEAAGKSVTGTGHFEEFELLAPVAVSEGNFVWISVLASSDIYSCTAIDPAAATDRRLKERILYEDGFPNSFGSADPYSFSRPMQGKIWTNPP